MTKATKILRIPDIQARKQQNQKITMLTAYDAWSARLLAQSGLDMLLVGDSLGMVQLGYSTTVPVTMGDMVRHTRAVRTGAPDSIVVADLPFLSVNLSPAQALRNAGQLLQNGGATAVKLEGGEAVAPAVKRIVSAGIPVMGHLGLTPQSVHVLGGFRRQAKTREEQERVIADARALEDAGAFSIVLECVPDELGRELSATLRIPVIGIGSGPDCDGQVLVTHDILGFTGPLVPSFAKQYANGGQQIVQAATAYVQEVISGRFPLPSGQRSFQTVNALSDVRTPLQQVRRTGGSIGFVPTMGALHAGHAQLLAQARRENDFLVASIFVNPLQFDREEDLKKYPRTMESDLQLCREEGVDLVFAPQFQDLYPSEQLTFVESPFMERFLCGEHRPGHFRGVATVVMKLLHIVQPDRSYFGEKDAQQLAIIRRMVADFNMSVAIVGVPTVRESDGLALSSRNQHLSQQERSVAPALWRALRKAAELLDRGERSAEAVKRSVLPELDDPQIRLEYFELSDPTTLTPVQTVANDVLIAGAIWLGTTRLIDNVTWSKTNS